MENIPTRKHNELIELIIEPILCMSDLLLQRLLRRSASSLLVFIGGFLMLASAAYSQSAVSPLWRILETRTAQMPALPAHATQAVPVAMDAGVLAALPDVL